MSDSSSLTCLIDTVTAFHELSTASAWLNVIGLIILSFLLLSYAVLPAQMTNKHYLNICLIVSAVLLNVRVPHMKSTQIADIALAGVYYTIRLEVRSVLRRSHAE